MLQAAGRGLVGEAAAEEVLQRLAADVLLLLLPLLGQSQQQHGLRLARGLPLACCAAAQTLLRAVLMTVLRQHVKHGDAVIDPPVC